LNGEATTLEAAALIGRTARHFAHKVQVTAADGYASIETRFGRAELTARGDAMAIALTGANGDSVAALRELMTSHLTRFARSPLEIRWFE
jgi:hypothetical protein